MATGINRGVNAVSLAAVTATGAGGQFAIEAPYTAPLAMQFTWQSIVTGAPATISITLEGSLDGSTWFVLDTSTQVAGETRFVTAKNAVLVRANLGTLTGGTAPTVTVNLAAF